MDDVLARDVVQVAELLPEWEVEAAGFTPEDWQEDPRSVAAHCISTAIERAGTGIDDWALPWEILDRPQRAAEGRIDLSAASSGFLLAQFVEGMSLTPFTLDQGVARHLAKIANGRAGKVKHSDLAPLAARELPNLTNISLQDVLDLRQNEEIFEKVREALAGLSAVVASSHFESYEELRMGLRREVESKVIPVHRELSSLERRMARNSKIWSTLSAGVVRLGITGLHFVTHGFSAAAIEAAKIPAGDAVKAGVRRRAKNNARSVSAANKILIQITE
jgi:hypothetical protein